MLIRSLYERYDFMEISWLGHSSFLIKNSNGKKIITDPFDDSVGYNIYTDNVDIVTISHQHFDHNYTEKLQGNPTIINKGGTFTVDGITIIGLPSFHDKMKGAKRGENNIYIIEVDGYRICHLGDLGHLLTAEDIDKLGDIDVLLIPVGGNFTIDGKEAAETAKEINSHIVIPMHYKTSLLSFPLDGVEPFLTSMKSGETIGTSPYIIEGELKEFNLVKILSLA